MNRTMTAAKLRGMAGFFESTTVNLPETAAFLRRTAIAIETNEWDPDERPASDPIYRITEPTLVYVSLDREPLTPDHKLKVTEG